MEELRCLVCQGQSIADSDAELAGDMRDLVRERIAAGEPPATIRAWLVERYGSWISYSPAGRAADLAALGRARCSSLPRARGWSRPGCAGGGDERLAACSC